ncbi:MAG: flippase-like domain-containing protein, partial [Candidatus Aminicenantes bacterium]|nr:flippase-like domain-containing protein [Candidatus Aminicenantes bacterium]
FHLLILFGLRLCYWVLRTAGWRIVVNAYGHPVRFIQLFQARIAGHAISYLTPSSFLGGETVRTLMMKIPDRKKALASVIVDKTIELLAMLSFLVAGFAIGIFRLAWPPRTIILSFSAVIVAASLVVVFYLQQKKGLLTWIFDTLERIRIRFSFIEKNRAKIKETDRLIMSFYKDHKVRFRRVFILYVFLVLFWAGEIHFTILFLGAHGASVLDSFLIVTLGILVFLLPTVPAALGTYELTYLGLFLVFGLGAGLGMAVTLLRRSLALFWAGIGLLAILKSQLEKTGKGGLFLYRSQKSDNDVKVVDQRGRQ